MQNLKTSESGRSMVEMLGVLAIIGVLSVGGLNGYGLVMKKHKANELLHQASMLAITISAQAMTNAGKLPQTITSFGNGSYGTFSTGATDALGGKGFSITIENVDSAVCEQLEKMQGGIAQKIECVDAGNDKKNAKLTFYKNLATTSKEQGEADGSLNGSCTESSDKCDGGTYYVCENGTWVSRSAPAGTACNGDTLGLSDSCNGSETTCLNGTYYLCSNGSWVKDGVCDCNDGSEKCENGTYYECTIGSWEETGYGCCNGNTLVRFGETATINGVTKMCSEGEWLEACNNYLSEKCENGTYHFCSSFNFWVTGYGCCNGNTPAPDGSEKCENGTYYECSDSSWVTGDGCCNGNTPVGYGETATINGVTKICSDGGWLESCNHGSEKCEDGIYYLCENGTWFSQSVPAGKACNGDTLGLSEPCNESERICLNGAYYYCGQGSWVTTDGGCCNGNTPVGYGTTATINGVTKKCAFGEWLEPCNDDKCENGTYYYCSSGYWLISPSDCECIGWGDKCENGTYYTCNDGSWVTNASGCCNGNTPVPWLETATINGVTKMCDFGEWLEPCNDELSRKCENGTYYLCSSINGSRHWEPRASGCCNGNSPVGYGETATINGVIKKCSNGEWI